MSGKFSWLTNNKLIQKLTGGGDKGYRIGTCGYGFYEPPDDWENYSTPIQAYSSDFGVLEMNRTFSKLPSIETAEKWFYNASKDFEFTMRAWQAITHPVDSPTWRGFKNELSIEEKKSYGYLRPNEEVFEAWEKTKEIADTLEAKIIVIQTPNDFDCSDKNKRNMREFLSEIDSSNIEIAWEPRGDWNDNLDEVKEICSEFNLIHVVDLMRNKPVKDHSIFYTRLHGLNEYPYDYDYNYSEDELLKLAKKIKKLIKNHDQVYCLFNNEEMYENGKELREITRKL
ncbi:MAG: DUF72 domain-containing protein [Hadesarchaea archaeon]|nr:DUF72 domain-containing protein [Hadesarchaea archaeon]